MDANTNPHSHEPYPIRHETSDVNIWAIGKFGIALVILTLLSVGLLIGVFRFFETRDPLAATADPMKVFPSPKLVANEPKVLSEYQADETKAVDSYGWVDQSKGVVRIPVDQALEIVARRGLPSRPPGAQASGVSVPTESGLGTPLQPPAGESPAAESKSTSEGKPSGEAHTPEGHEGTKK